MEPFLGEIRFFPFPFAPQGWALCNGAVLPISRNQALFSLLGVVYGGDGKNTFALPDLRGRVPVHKNNQQDRPIVPLGMSAGEETHVLTTNEIPAHTHTATGSNAVASEKTSPGNYWAQASTTTYGTTPDTTMSESALQTVGNSAPHTNMQPYFVGNFCIAIQGIYPSRN
ncbi:phage tail protein [Brevibacillus sp. MS2.2]|uniref:phage tail protein n=1 Tax=Brevibacillus sp. MS2.2 TaxID=2738981 RepID=UPI00156AF59E|nr:tail fiber protein [Brevibacillus sp. MS2.2]NRR20822.1 phage tail protein [Brevibacillus sp. MS2.2]